MILCKWFIKSDFFEE